MLSYYKAEDSDNEINILQLGTSSNNTATRSLDSGEIGLLADPSAQMNSIDTPRSWTSTNTNGFIDHMEEPDKLCNDLFDFKAFLESSLPHDLSLPDHNKHHSGYGDSFSQGFPSATMSQNLNESILFQNAANSPTIPTKPSEVKYHLHIMGIPNSGARSRTEIQIRLNLKLVAFSTTANGLIYSLPTIPFKCLRLLTAGSIGKNLDTPNGTSKYLSLGNQPISSKEMVLASAKVVRSTDGPDGEELKACYPCQLRERRKLDRKKSKKATVVDGSESQFADEAIPMVLFAGSSDVLEFSDKGEVMVPCRITCYCRHHDEKVGFRIALHLHDGSPEDLLSTESFNVNSKSPSDLASCSNLFGLKEIAKQISPPIMITDDHKRPSSLKRPDESTGNGSFSPRSNIATPRSSYVYSGHERKARLTPLIRSTSCSTDQPPIKRIWVDCPNGQLVSGGVTTDIASLPTIIKVVPGEGPLYGGIEITVIGKNLDAKCAIYFGGILAPLVLFLSSNTVVVRLPPSLTAGLVPVSVVKDQHALANLTFSNDANQLNATTQVLFHYKNDLDRAMMELALQLIGMKMTGRVDDARDVAIRIIQENTSGSTSPQTMSGNPSESLESSLITCLTCIEINNNVDFTAQDFCKVRTFSGQTLLHLAGLQGYTKLFEYLASFDGELTESMDESGFLAADLAYIAGMYPMLAKLGLDEAYMEKSELEPRTGLKPMDEADLSFLHKYNVILAGARERQLFVGRISRVGNYLRVLFREPARLRGLVQRIRTSIWRRLGPSKTVKPYYYQQLLFAATVQPQVVGSHGRNGNDPNRTSIRMLTVVKKRVVETALRISKIYRELQIFGRYTPKDVLFNYVWVPIVVAAILVWINNVCTRWMQTKPASSSSVPVVLSEEGAGSIGTM